MTVNQEVKKLWVDALRSGEYTQGFGLSYYTFCGEPHFCALGVLEELAVQNGVLSRSERSDAGLSWKAARWLGYDPNLFYGQGGVSSKLITKNDLLEESFDVIADYIEENL